MSPETQGYEISASTGGLRRSRKLHRPTTGLPSPLSTYEVRELQHQQKVYVNGHYLAAVQQGKFRPYIHPVLTPGGHVVTEIATADHLHHLGIWFAHEDIDGVNFWAPESQWTVPCPRMLVSRSDVDVADDGVTFRQEVDWLDGDEHLCMRDSRVIVIGERPGHTMVDVTVTVRADERPIRMGQTKEAGLALRVSDQIDVLDGGRITNANGQVNEAETFDQVSDWVDYSGPVSRAQVSGIAIFPHPGSDRIPWFTRDYGPLYVSPWRHEEITLAPGATRTVGARFAAHDGSCEEADVAGLYARFLEEIA